jgi:hypothetical protein
MRRTLETFMSTPSAASAPDAPGTPAVPASLQAARIEAPLVTATEDDEALSRQNAYLRLRVAQLQDDVSAITAEAERLRQTLERLHGRTTRLAPNPLGGGQ